MISEKEYLGDLEDWYIQFDLKDFLKFLSNFNNVKNTGNGHEFWEWTTWYALHFQKLMRCCKKKISYLGSDETKIEKDFEKVCKYQLVFKDPEKFEEKLKKLKEEKKREK